jgi:hypothetical protein
MNERVKEQIGYYTVALMVFATWLGTYLEAGAGKAWLAAAGVLGASGGALTLLSRPPTAPPPK